MAKPGRGGSSGGGTASGGRPAEGPPTGASKSNKGAKRPVDDAVLNGYGGGGSGGAAAKRRKVEQHARKAAAGQSDDACGGDGGGGEQGKQHSREQQGRQSKQKGAKVPRELAAEAESAAAAAAATPAAAVTAAAKAAKAPQAAPKPVKEVVVDAAAAVAAEPDAVAAKPARRRAQNSNWEALKSAVAAAKKPPPSEHVLARRAKAKAKKKAAAGVGGGAAAAAAAVGGGRRPGLVGSETGLTKVLALDCEMVGVGPKGAQSVLARVCLVNSSGAVLLDTFVQPKERVTDFRTWVSGVRPSDLVGGRPYDEVIQQVGELVRDRILVGHAIGHDLRALMLEEHPRALLRDTAKYPGLMKELTQGRRVSASLKDLAATHLGLTIQEGEHSPVDDARAALYLYQKHHREWEAAVRSGQLVPVVGGLGRKGGAGRSAPGKARRGEKAAAATSGRAKGRGALGVAGGGVRKRKDGRAGLHAAVGKANSGKGGKAAIKAPIWSLERDPYADL